MESNNIDDQILDYLSKPLDNEESHFFSAKLAILDTIGCIIHASSDENVHSFASGETSVELFKNPFKTLKVAINAFYALPKKVRFKNFHEIKIEDLPQIKCWKNDGGAFVTLPQVYSEDLDNH